MYGCGTLCVKWLTVARRACSVLHITYLETDEMNRYRVTLRDGREAIVYGDNQAQARHEAERQYGRVAKIAPVGSL